MPRPRLVPFGSLALPTLVAGALVLVPVLHVPPMQDEAGDSALHAAGERGSLASLEEGPRTEPSSRDRETLPQEAWLEVEVATIGVDLASGLPLALVHEGWEEVLPIWIGEVEAEAILRVLQRVALPRPMTHDLFASVLQSLDAELAEVRIHDIRDATYIGSLHLRRDGSDELIEVDTRPSDGLALAVRTGARIRVARRLLAGAPDVDFVSTERDRPIARLRGATVAEPGAEDRERFGLPDRRGVVVLHADAEAASRGLTQGDLIVEVEGQRINTALDYLNAVARQSGNQVIPLTVVRDGQETASALPPRRGPAVVGD